MHEMQFVPWRQIASWRCTTCGNCCKDYSVVLNFPEWINIAQRFGAQYTVTGLDKLLLKRGYDGSCVFLCRFAGTYLCSLQSMKPEACKIWPFKILSEPKYGEAKDAAFDYAGKHLFVYADANCAGLRYGAPSREFTSVTLKEFADIALGICRTQRSSTRNGAIGVPRRFSF
jgi:Fe-S-cluster containining protein